MPEARTVISRQASVANQRIMKTNFLNIPRRRLSTLLPSAILIHPLGAAVVWTGGIGNYDTGSNWDTGVVPILTDDIEIKAGTATKTGNLGRQANTSIEGGNLVINGGRFLNASSGPGNFTISDGSLEQTGHYFIIGTNAAGTFSQSGGTVNATVERGFFVSDGGGSSSKLTVSNGSFSVNHDGTYNTDLHNTWLGRGGQNDQVLVNGGSFSVSNTAAGTSQRRFYLGRDAGFRIDSGSATINDMQYVIVGRANGTTTGTPSFEVNGGAVEVGVNTAFVVGGGLDANVSMTGGSFEILKVGGAGGDLWINDGGATLLATVALSDGVFNIEGNLVLGRNSTGKATFSMTGGELRAASLRVGASLDPLFEFAGGEIFLEGDQTAVISEAWFDGVTGTTANFDSSTDLTHIYVIPEPSSMLLVGLGVFLTGVRRRR